MQKQFEKSFDIPNNADVEAMASYITPAHMLVTEIPLNPNFQQQQQQQTPQMDFLNVNNNPSDQRRLSFSLNKFNTLNAQDLLSPANNVSTLSAPTNQGVRRTSITKTTTTTTGPAGLSPEAVELLRSIDTTGSNTQTYSTHVTERRPSNTSTQPIIINQPNLSSPPPPPIITTNNQTKSSSILTSAGMYINRIDFLYKILMYRIDLANLPIEIPPELLLSGGTITIQKRKVSVTRTADPNAAHPN